MDTDDLEALGCTLILEREKTVGAPKRSTAATLSREIPNHTSLRFLCGERHNHRNNRPRMRAW